MTSQLCFHISGLMCQLGTHNVCEGSSEKERALEPRLTIKINFLPAFTSLFLPAFFEKIARKIKHERLEKIMCNSAPYVCQKKKKLRNYFPLFFTHHKKKIPAVPYFIFLVAVADVSRYFLRM